jgi:peptide/nickel transport system ATP-binding protein
MFASEHAIALRSDAISVVIHSRRGPVYAVEDVSFSVPKGQTIGIVGESGCGKSTLARAVMGLLANRRGIECTGASWLAGANLLALSDDELRKIWGRDIAMVFQDPMTALNPVMKVQAQIVEPMKVHLKLEVSEGRKRSLGLLRDVGIREPERILNSYPHQLSGGMRQRVTIAMALACNPSVLIADEPTTGLDVTVQAQILELLTKLRIERSMALLVISHDLAVVAGRTDITAVMYAGRIVEIGPTAEVFREPRMPYTYMLMKAIPDIAKPSHSRLETIPGRPPRLNAHLVGCRFRDRCPRAAPKCAREEPPLEPDGDDGHLFRCWYPVTNGS